MPDEMKPVDVTEEMRAHFDPEMIKWMMLNPNAYMGHHYNADDIIREEENLKWKWHEKEKIDDEEEWNENFEEKDTTDDAEIKAEELVEPPPMEEQCKAQK